MYRANIKILIVLLLVTFIGAFLRFYKLDEYPVQLNHDEISQLYDVDSIVQTGRDIYGNFLPLAFPSTGDFKVGHYIYITIFPYLIFGLREATVRIPGVFFGTLIIPAAFLFINQLTKNWKLAMVAAAALAITPSEIFYSRKSFESVIGIFFVFLGLFLLLRELEKKKSTMNVFFTGLFLALPMYIYTAYVIVMPLVIVAFTILFRRKIIPQYKKFIAIFLIWSLFTMLLVYIALNNPGIRFRAASVSIFQDAGLAGQLDDNKKENPVLSSLYRIKVVSEYSFTKYLKQFDPVHIFANGLDLTNQGIMGMGPLMILQLPFFVLGIIYLLRFPYLFNEGRFIFVLLILAMIPSGFTFEKFSPHRSVWAFSLMSVISAFGFFWFYLIIQIIKDIRFRASIIFLIGAFLLLNLIYFMHMYTINAPYEKSQEIHYPYKDVALFAWSQYDKFDHIIIDPVYGQVAPVKAVAAHYYLAYYGQYSPEKFQKDLKMDKVGISFDKFSIREIDWGKDQQLKNTLIIASPWSVPVTSVDRNKILRVFTFFDKQPAFYAIKL